MTRRRRSARPARPETGGRSSVPSRQPSPAAAPPRIIGGDLRGRRLAHRPGEATRPMKDRVRESLFDLLGTTVRGSLALDFFAGTGALGFEALSRGARRAVFVERHFPTADTIRSSARDLGVADRCDVFTGDVLLWPLCWPELPVCPHWVAFVSPPWSFFAAGSDRRAELLALVAAVWRAAPAGSVVVVESDTGFDPADLPDAAAWERRAIQPAVLHIRRS